MNLSPSLGHILLVDDDSNITSLLQVNLRSEGYSVDVVDNAESVDRTAQDSTSLVIVDAMNQPYSGMDLIYDFKDDPATEHIAIILYSPIKKRAHGNRCPRCRSRRLHRQTILAQRITRACKIGTAPPQPQYPQGHPAILPQPHPRPDFADCKIDGTPLALTRTEYAILHLLIKNVDTYVSRIELHHKVWPDTAAGANERIVDTNISRLRKKLGDLGNNLINRSGRRLHALHQPAITIICDFRLAVCKIISIFASHY